MGIKLRVCNPIIRLKMDDAALQLKYTEAVLRLKSAVTVIHETDGGEAYEGDYTVTPKTMSEKVLSTKGKIMEDDVTVLRMPQFGVANDAGGMTLILGDEYYGK